MVVKKAEREQEDAEIILRCMLRCLLFHCSRSSAHLFSGFLKRQSSITLYSLVTKDMCETKTHRQKVCYCVTSERTSHMEVLSPPPGGLGDVQASSEAFASAFASVNKSKH